MCLATLGAIKLASFTTSTALIICIKHYQSMLFAYLLTCPLRAPEDAWGCAAKDATCWQQPALLSNCFSLSPLCAYRCPFAFQVFFFSFFSFAAQFRAILMFELLFLWKNGLSIVNTPPPYLFIKLGSLVYYQKTADLISYQASVSSRFSWGISDWTYQASPDLFGWYAHMP